MTRIPGRFGNDVGEWVGGADDLDAEIAGTGIPAFTVDLAGVKSKQALMEALRQALRLPAHFGGNWDALADCLGDRAWLPKRGAFVALRHTAELRRRSPADWATLLEILAETANFWQARGMPFRVRYS